jgi:hypothetical protein
MSASPIDAAVEGELRLAFVGRLPGRVESIEAAWSRFAKNREPADFEPLKTLVQRLAASASSYGLDEVGAMARELDRQTHPVVAIAPFTERFAALREAVERAAAGERH